MCIQHVHFHLVHVDVHLRPRTHIHIHLHMHTDIRMTPYISICTQTFYADPHQPPGPGAKKLDDKGLRAIVTDIIASSRRHGRCTWALGW